MPREHKHKYFIGSRGYTSKNAAINYTRSIIRDIGYRKIYNDDVHYQFLHDLLQNHTEKETKIGVGIDHFEITHHPVFKQPYLLACRLDGTCIDISYNHCCEFKERPQNRNLTCAMRYAVKDMTISYKATQDRLTCNTCHNDRLDYSEYHVDHIVPFSELYKQFMHVNTLPVPTVFDDTIHDIPCFTEIDTEFKINWIRYHNTRATLQILCSTCNLKKGNR